MKGRGSLTDMESGVQCNNAALKQKVQQYLDEYEIKHARKGYQYLVASISIGCRNPQKIFSQTDLLNQVAFSFGTQPDCVERAIRYAIRGTNMTNKEFIQCAVDKIHL